MYNFRVVIWFMRIFTSILILLISNCCSWSFYKKNDLFSISSLYPNLGYMVFFSNLILILLIFFYDVLLNLFFFWVSPFNKKLVVFLILIFILILLIFWVFLINWFFFINFTLQSKLKYILCFNFDPHSFNCYFLNLFL
jgi:hypothetical protein